MKEINLGRVLTENRHKKGITQDELAAHIGVSKGAVSKWETGSSLPDISLLPLLASYFGISIDELIGYEPQMEKDDIQKLYVMLSRKFSEQPFNEVFQKCLDIEKKYFSCFPLLFQLGTLLINHVNLASDPDQVKKILETALEWFRRVRSGADEPNLQKDATLMEAFCLLQLRRPTEVIDILSLESLQTGSAEPLLSSAYRMTGDDREAKKILQVGIYRKIMTLLDMLPSYLNLCLQEPEQFAETCRRFDQIVDAFQLKTLHPSILLGIYITIAQGFMFQGKTEQAMDALTQYTDLAAGNIYPLHLHGDEFFNLLDEWFEQELTLGSFPPRDEGLIKRSMTAALAKNPAFKPLAGDRRFQSLINRLQMMEEGN